MSYDHYVPQFYLRAFKIEKTTQSIYLYQRGQDPKQKNIGNIGGDNHYEERDIKAFFKQKDTEWAKTFQTIREAEDKFEVLDETIIHSLNEFISHQIFRTPKILRLLKNYSTAIEQGEDTLKSSKRQYVKKLQLLGHTKKEAQKRADTAFSMPMQLLDAQNPISEELNLKNSISLAQKLEPQFLNRLWTPVDNTMSNNHFITSDHPVSIFGNESNGYFGLVDELMNKQFFLPITPNFGIITKPSPSAMVTNTKPLFDNEIEELNTIMINSSADKEIYSHKKHTAIKEAFDQSNPQKTTQWKFISDDNWRN